MPYYSAISEKERFPFLMKRRFFLKLLRLSVELKDRDFPKKKEDACTASSFSKTSIA